MNTYPTVYRQMQAMLKLMRAPNRAHAIDSDYTRACVQALEDACLLIECEAIDDSYTGEIYDFEGLEYRDVNGEEFLNENDLDSLMTENEAA